MFFILISTVSWGQAEIDFYLIEQTLYVDNRNPLASDRNSGNTPELPLLTLEHAVERSKHKPSRIIVYPGHYRSYLDIYSSQLLVVEAETPGHVFITGSDVFTDWIRDGEIYQHDWFYKWGYYEDSEACFGPCGLTDYQRRREMLFIDSVPVIQVTDMENLEENSFFVDENNNKINLKPAAGIDPKEAKVEVATRGFDIYDLGRNGSLVRATVYEGRGLVLRGLVFQHTANTMHQDALTITDTKNVLIEDCIFQWNNGVGFELERCSNVTVRNTISRYNGERGIGAGSGENILFENILIYENNWRTNSPAMIAHDAAGIKIFGSVKNVVLENVRAFNNYCHAIWFDWNNENFTIRNSYINNNQESGIMLEGSRKPAYVENCTIMNNDIGIKGYGHANVTVTNSIIYSNNHQFSFGQDGRVVEDDDGWEINSSDWKIYNNYIIATEISQKLFSFFEYKNPDSPSTRASNEFFKTTRADNNIYFHPLDKKQFPDGNHLEGGQLTFSSWKKKTGQDKNSEWRNSGSPE
jgi:parallel beta-helix repeat protein